MYHPTPRGVRGVKGENTIRQMLMCPPLPRSVKSGNTGDHGDSMWTDPSAAIV